LITPCCHYYWCHYAITPLLRHWYCHYAIDAIDYYWWLFSLRHYDIDYYWCCPLTLLLLIITPLMPLILRHYAIDTPLMPLLLILRITLHWHYWYYWHYYWLLLIIDADIIVDYYWLTSPSLPYSIISIIMPFWHTRHWCHYCILRHCQRHYEHHTPRADIDAILIIRY
jgi:hypothetical protein